MSKLTYELKPSYSANFSFSPENRTLQRMIDGQLEVLLGCSPLDLGYEGSAYWCNLKDKALVIVSRFDIRKILTSGQGTSFSEGMMVNPLLQSLEGYFFKGDIAERIYDIDEAARTVTFSWNPSLLLAYLTDSNIADPNFGISSKPILRKVKGGRKDMIPAIITVRRSDYRGEYDGPMGFEPFLD